LFDPGVRFTATENRASTRPICSLRFVRNPWVSENQLDPFALCLCPNPEFCSHASDFRLSINVCALKAAVGRMDAMIMTPPGTVTLVAAPHSNYPTLDLAPQQPFMMMK
jgi:hypothetical protein